MWPHSMDQFPHLVEINHTFLESGHFHSFHNRNCKEKHQCLCSVPVEHSYFNGMTWKALPWCAIEIHGYVEYLVQKFCPNLRSTTSRDKVNWMNICGIQTRRDYPHTLNETFDEACSRRLKSKQQRERRIDHPFFPVCFPNAIKQDPCLCCKEGRLCKQQIIPEDCHEH